jgi:hypothetical protein
MDEGRIIELMKSAYKIGYAEGWEDGKGDRFAVSARSILFVERMRVVRLRLDREEAEATAPPHPEGSPVG